MVQAGCRGGDGSQVGRLYRALRLLRLTVTHTAVPFIIIVRRCGARIRDKVAAFENRYLSISSTFLIITRKEQFIHLLHPQKIVLTMLATIKNYKWIDRATNGSS